MDYEVYNPGIVIEESIKFSLSSDRTDHATGNYLLRLPKADFARLPTELEIGDATIRVEFPFDAVRKFGNRGVTLIVSDKEKKKLFGDGEIPEHMPYALTREEARTKGDSLWHQYTLNVAQIHVDESMKARAEGGMLRKATGFTSYCLKLHNVIDPADELFMRMTQGAPILQQKVDKLESVLNGILAIPEVSKALAARGVSLETVKPVADPSPAPVKKQVGGRPSSVVSKNRQTEKRATEALPSPQKLAGPPVTA